MSADGKKYLYTIEVFRHPLVARGSFSALAMLFGTLALMPRTGFAQKACTQPTEFQPALCQFVLPRITTMEVIENGARSSPTAEPTLDCAKFTLSTRQVARYFSKARQIKDESDSHHTLDWFPCYASGTLRLADGRQAEWVIEQGQTGTLTIAGEKKRFLYCSLCKFKPFLW